MKQLASMDILYDGGDWFALDKPSGLPVHRGYTGERDTVADRLRAEMPEGAHTVHRLDRGTSGVLIVARTADRARELGALFQEHRLTKTYVALTRGVAPDEIEVDYPVPSGPDKGAPRVEARTHLRRLAFVRLDGSPLHEPRYSLVVATPSTGRFHQVRRHLAHLAHPIVGDSDHGRPDHNRLLRDRVGLGRLALHAASLRLPLAGGEVVIVAPLPADLTRPLTALGFDLPALLP